MGNWLFRDRTWPMVWRCSLWVAGFVYVRVGTFAAVLCASAGCCTVRFVHLLVVLQDYIVEGSFLKFVLSVVMNLAAALIFRSLFTFLVTYGRLLTFLFLYLSLHNIHWIRKTFCDYFACLLIAWTFWIF